MKIKAILAVILSMLLVFSTAGAALASDSGITQDTVIAQENLDAVVESIVGELVGASDKATLSVDTSALLAGADEDGDGETTVSEVSGSLAKYIFVKYDEIDAISSRIAESSQCRAVVTDGGVSTVYIYVNIEENPEIMNLDVFRETVKKLASSQNSFAAEGGLDYTLMNYRYIAGELALHTAVYALTVLTGTNSAGNSLYDSAKEAELNIDESRVPTSIIEFIGTFIMDIIFATFYSIYQLF